MTRYLSWAILFFALAFGIGSTADVVCAWEFSLDGNFSSTYELYSQQGSQRFFRKSQY